MGLNPLEPVMLDVRMHISQIFAYFGHYNHAIDNLENMKEKLTEWNERMNMDEPGPHRTRILRLLVQIDMAMGNIYAGSLVGQQTGWKSQNGTGLDDLQSAESCFLSAVKSTLKETERRERQGVKEDEGDWIPDEEVVSTLENLADAYEAQSKHALAAPLYLRALTLENGGCHRAVLMNNFAASLAQTLPEQMDGPATSRPILISNAKAWAEKARKTAEATKGEQRTEECDQACAVAMHNLAEFAEMEGLFEEARGRYKEAEKLAGELGFQEGVDNAREGIKRIDGNSHRIET